MNHVHGGGGGGGDDDNIIHANNNNVVDDDYHNNVDQHTSAPNRSPQNFLLKSLRV